MPSSVCDALLPVYSPLLTITKARGSFVEDENGKKYLDFVTGVSCCNLGHCHKSLNKTLVKQSEKLWHISNWYANNPQKKLAEKIISESFVKFNKNGKVFFCNSGTEANECLIKFARKWGSKQGKYEIICLKNSFHGRTYASLAATGKEKLREGFAPHLEGFKHIEANMESLKKAFSSKTVAVLIETILGEAGVLLLDEEFIKNLRAFCDKNKILLLIDEVQTGMGRTGELFSFQHYGISPDAFSLAKALGNGFPIGACVIADDFSDCMGLGDHGSTFGGNPLACSIALKVFEIMEEEKILKNCNKTAQILQKFLKNTKKEFPLIQSIRQKGLMIGIDLTKSAKKFVEICLKHFILIIFSGENTIRLLPPLNIKKEEVQLFLKNFYKALKEFTNNE